MFYQHLTTSTRLVILLTLTVSIVMAIGTVIPLREREASLRKAAQDEIEAHALTLQLALEEDFNSGRSLDAQRLLNRLTENVGIHGVALFDEKGQVTVVSKSLATNQQDSLAEVRKVIATGKRSHTVQRRINDTDVLSMILPLRANNHIIGAIEVSAPNSFVQQLIYQNRVSAFTTWFLLCFAIFLVVVFVTNRSLMRPIKALLYGADAISRGDLSQRIYVPGGGNEFGMLAQAFNRMAQSLNEQRVRAARAADERVKLERKLRHSQRLAAVGHLAAGVAHEMGAPLQVIDGRAKQLQDASSLNPEKQARNLQIIRTQTERITRIVRSLLNLSRPFHPKFAELDLLSVIDQTLDTLEIQIQEANIRLFCAQKKPVLIYGDRELLGQVFLNLFVNAIHAMPNGGALRVVFDQYTESSTENLYAVVRVYDSGTGINAEHIEHIFDPFYTTKEVGHGTGLGLAVSSRIVEEHHGWIEAANWEEQDGSSGAVFSVHLPACNVSVSRSEEHEMVMEMK